MTVLVSMKSYSKNHDTKTIKVLRKVIFSTVFFQNIYAGKVGCEFEYISNKDEKTWLAAETENTLSSDLPKDEKIKILKEIIRTGGFENFLHKRFPGAKRFSVEGGDSSINSVEKIIDFAAKSGVKKVIVLSTDKAVYPINAMGTSKAMMEKVAVAKSRNINGSNTVICCTRYGNVMASRGSVIPLFINQIRDNKPITLTDPDMTRFMMTLEDAVDLVLFAFKNAHPGDMFVQKAPAATIEVLAKALKELYKSDASIKVIGTRHGEKLYESLLTREEVIKAEDLGEYYRIPADNRDLNYANYYSKGEVDMSKIEDYHSHNTHRLDVEGMKQLLLKLDFINNDIKEL